MAPHPVPGALAALWRDRLGLADPPGRWTPLAGGRTNAVWRVDGAGGAVVIKLYRPGAETPLFGNDAGAEAAALVALAGSGLAPRLLGLADTPEGPSLAYAHVAGRPWRPGDGVAPVAHALARLHRRPAPPGLPLLDTGARALRAQSRAMLAGLGPEGRALGRLEPGPVAPVAPVAPCFLHGDATAGNALVTPGGITFIDWQCPARGDPVADLAVFLSPAMQAVSGNPPLGASQEAAFLEAFGDAAAAARYRALAPLFHWRMAAYCLWRAARGDAGYGAAAGLEIAQLRGSTPPRSPRG